MLRNMVGYGNKESHIQWPKQARVAINFVINYEEGAELTPVNGDNTAEIYGGEFPLAVKPLEMRNLSQESLFEYGSRAGIWRLLRLFDSASIPITFFLTGYALTLNPVFCNYLKSTQHEIAGHGWRWIDYALLTKQDEQKHVQQCIDTITKLTGKRPQGWYTGRRSEHTRNILLEIGGFVYDSDSYADDVPYLEGEHLIIPYTLDCNDFRYTTSPGFGTPDDFFLQLKNTFDFLYAENRPTLMTVGLHARISGHPGRCMVLKKFIDHLKHFPDIWIARRIDIAKHFLKIK